MMVCGAQRKAEIDTSVPKAGNVDSETPWTTPSPVPPVTYNAEPRAASTVGSSSWKPM